jgi:hypothetical protein
VPGIRGDAFFSGTIAGVFPSMPQDEPWDADATRDVARAALGGRGTGTYGAVPDEEPRTGHRSTGDDRKSEPEDEEEFEEIEVVPVRRQLSLAIAVFGAESAAPDSRTPYAIVLFGVQLLYLLAWTMALRPPAASATAGVCVAVALVADYLAASQDSTGVFQLILVALGGFVVALIGQLFRAEDRARVTDSWRTTLVIVLGVVAYAIPVLLTRVPLGTQTVMLCAAAAGVALLVARVTDAIFPKPRIAPQVPRGASGVVLGAMLGTLTAAALGSYLVLPFTPAKGAVIGLIAAVVASLVDLAVNFGEAGRTLAGDPPTFWVARHMQGPLGAFALVAPFAYGLTYWFMS